MLSPFRDDLLAETDPIMTDKHIGLLQFRTMLL